MHKSRIVPWLVVPLLAAASLLGLSGPAHAADGDPVVRVGTEGTYPPFTYIDPRSQQLTGFDVEVIKAVGEEGRLAAEVRRRAPFDAIFPALDANRIDVIANQITINPEREARYLFTQPYTYSHGVIVTAADNDDIKTLADLKGRTAAESETSNWAQVARDAGAKVKSVDQFAPGGRAARPGSGRRDRQRQHRGARLPGLDGVEEDQDRRATPATRSAEQALDLPQERPEAARPGRRRH